MKRVTQTLLLGMALSAGPVPAAEVVTVPGNSGVSAKTLSQAAQGMAIGQRSRRAGKPKITGNKGAAERAPKKGTDGAEEATPQSGAPVESESIALRGVRG